MSYFANIIHYKYTAAVHYVRIHNKGVSLYKEKEQTLLSSTLPFNITETEQACVKGMPFLFLISNSGHIPNVVSSFG